MRKINFKDIFYKLAICILVISIPVMLTLYAYKAKQYTELKKDIVNYEKQQEKLIQENKELINDIAVLTSAERIEEIAVDELGMHKANSDDIVRIEMTGEKD